MDQERDETVCSNVIIKQIKAEKEAEPSSVCSTRYTSVGGGGRSRQNLTEVLKAPNFLVSIFCLSMLSSYSESLW